MFPMEFDHLILDSLPLPDEEDMSRVTQILEAMIVRRVLPYFKRKRGTDPILAARVAESVKIRRMDDGDNRVRCVSLLSREDKLWTIDIHERIFDYLAFVIPSDPQSRLGSGTTEEHKMLAFAEFMVRHQTEHIVYPLKPEREVIHSDAEFAMDKRAEDPTFYRMLRRAFEDEMNGLKGSNYVGLIEQAER
ncbi:MAG: ATP-dependent protease, partial [Deltaproteobacteria bacterium]|nr:ATP-dependent protease [Deltaproteobacteria bacterium]